MNTITQQVNAALLTGNAYQPVSTSTQPSPLSALSNTVNTGLYATLNGSLSATSLTQSLLSSNFSAPTNTITDQVDALTLSAIYNSTNYDTNLGVLDSFSGTNLYDSTALLQNYYSVNTSGLDLEV